MSEVEIIIVLLPIAAVMLICQTNPYHALIIRGVLGAIAALIYAILGAGDVSLTEALMGTLLAITLYAITVRSSLVFRLGAIEGEAIAVEDGKAKGNFSVLMADLKSVFKKHHMRVELVPYTNPQAMHRALMEKDIHAICTRKEEIEFDTLEYDDRDRTIPESAMPPYRTTTRIKRIYDIIQSEISSPEIILNYVNISNTMKP